MRRTKIVCTLGPASESPETIEALIEAGMDVARLNFSHGDQGTHAACIRRVRDISQRLGRAVAILQDLRGPKIRVGEIENGVVEIKTGSDVVVTIRPVKGTACLIPTSYASLPGDVQVGSQIKLNDGDIHLEVTRVEDADVHCHVLDGGLLSSHKGINLPGVHVSAPSFTPRDQRDLQFGIASGVDYVALSFVRCPEDVAQIRKWIVENFGDGEEMHCTPVIAKIEKPEAIHHLDAIMEVADGLMIARGDLGVETPLEGVPILQKEIIRKAAFTALPVITATQMLESMTHNPIPTRAETCDVANAVLDGTDAVMLSGETSVGEFPVETVQTMGKIIDAAERLMFSNQRFQDRAGAEHLGNFPAAICEIAAHAAEDTGAKWIVGFTQTGSTAALLSKQKSPIPIVVFSHFPDIERRLSLLWGVLPRRMPPVADTESLVLQVDRALLAEGRVNPGDPLVIVAGAPIQTKGHTNFLQLHRVGERDAR
ncbi:MAG: pyruvate kinase [Armatimonadetes bacterium CG07_land_8_20_14_0_80_59_28]|nr:MAG: pyruvate kinase [Armatimonadetes bacterium CG07_land_8_20_14_0_80_59_28]PIX43460.1 MAG: pyruvate kinase [Armatimonadetes bacterium CG_4_8_14_3_um_filter_58_9]PIY49462.1 MAG: pyruvate kinase [Armatimonadetes bacterium CG_4_10_14_3_um_filter_59_10]